MIWKTLESETDYNLAVDRINDLMDAKRTDAVQNELSLLSFLVEKYEEEFHPMPDASPLEVIRFTMEMKGIKQQDLIPVLGTKGNVSKILSGKAKLQVEDIYPLSVLLGIPAESLIPKENSYTETIEAEFIAEPSKPAREAIRVVMEPPQKPYQSKSHITKRAAKKKPARKTKS